MMHSFDVVVVGGGMVGLTLACGLQGCGLRIAVIESQQSSNEELSPQPSLRVSAINAGSERFLRQLGVWDNITAQRVSPYQGMEVWDRDSFGRIEFQAEEHGYLYLGHIIENEIIQRALRQKVGNCSDVTLFEPAQLKQVVWGENEAFLTLNDGRMLSARLVIGADGAKSWLRSHADIPLTFWDYGHSALVATIQTALPHEGYARQVFYDNSILAFLPLWQENRCSIVWSMPPELAERMKMCDPAEFTHQLEIAFDRRLGKCELESECLVFPLTARYARSFAVNRLALVGDAAHTIHPLAGQGVNLGFMDSAELLSEIKRLHKEGKDIGYYPNLRRYERNRKLNAAVMLASMQGFRTLFDGHNPLKKLARDLGLKLADSLPGVKPQLIRQAMGLNQLPDWLK